MGIRIGDYELTVLVDTHGVLGSLAELFPGVPTDAWGPYRDLYPDLFEDGNWRLPFGCFLLRSERHTLLVDAGVGPPQGSFLPEAEGLLPTALVEVGVAPGEIDACVLTHLHIDHIGWASNEGRPLFPRARYIASHADFNWGRGARAPGAGPCPWAPAAVGAIGEPRAGQGGRQGRSRRPPGADTGTHSGTLKHSHRISRLGGDHPRRCRGTPGSSRSSRVGLTCSTWNPKRRWRLGGPSWMTSKERTSSWRAGTTRVALAVWSARAHKRYGAPSTEYPSVGTTGCHRLSLS